MKDVNRDESESVEAKCPECSLLMADMGLDFKSPPKEDIKAWHHIKNLYTVGITFHSCGCSGPGYIPQTHEKLIEYLQTKQVQDIEQLRFWLHRQEPTTRKELDKDNRESYSYKWQLPRNLKEKKGKVENQKAIAYWTEKIKVVELRLEEMIIVNSNH